MESNARVIYKTHNSYLPTKLPVSFYGLPNGKVYVIYSRFYEKNLEKTGLEFVLAQHEEFYYDYEGRQLILLENNNKFFPVVSKLIDKPETKIKIKKVSRNLKTYSEAQSVLNAMAAKMVYYS
ncbi:MAG TPA: hypothetical protein VK872_01080 [Draconibacterium sp.]|nr:hypothetical protein [Draconibacterium sp.]